MRDPFRSGLQDFDGEWPERWAPEPGDMIVGQLVRYDGPIETEYGPGHVAVILDEDSGAERSVWLLETVLVNEFAALAPDPGERVGVKYMGLKTPKGGGKPYKNYVVRVQRQGQGAYNPFRQRPSSPESPTSPPPPSPSASYEGPTGAPARPSLLQLGEEWDSWMRKYRVEHWAQRAFALAHPDLPDDINVWSAEDFTEALKLVRSVGSPAFTRAGEAMGKREPADPELVQKVTELLEGVTGPSRLRVMEALDSNWQDAVATALDWLQPSQAPLPPAEEVFGDDEGSQEATAPDLSEPEDDLPF
jgi:hypothetical protein